MKIHPIYDRIVIKPVPEGRTTKGGLVIPDVAAQSKAFAFGDVIAAGTGRVNVEGKLVPLTIKVGDTVMFPRRAGTPIPLTEDDGTEAVAILLREPEILAVVTDLPRDSGLRDVDGRILAIMPSSRALPDSVYENREALEVAAREGWDTDHDAGEPDPGWTP